jgi:choice-of-anchor B domain-containing protein
VWGWTDATTNREYALVGRTDGVAFVDVTDPTNPAFLGELPMTENTERNAWREIKTYQDHAYVISEGSGHGMQVFDLTQLRSLRRGAKPVVFKEVAHYDRVSSSHNVVINEESGYAYIVGAGGPGESCGGALHMVDIREPRAPKFAGCHADSTTGLRLNGYIHDAQCVTYKGPDQRYTGREICVTANENAVNLVDVTDKAKPRVIATGKYPSPAYAHQGWFSADQRYWYMNDELDEGPGKFERTRTIIWDMADLEKPVATEFFGTTGATDHNLYINGNLMYQSNYQAGLRILDISDPLKPVEVAYFDTAPYEEDTAGFGGTWSNYPFFKSGTILVNSGNEGLFLIKRGEHLTP